MEYTFNGGCWGRIFAVPQSVVDNYIKLANEVALKVLLFVLRNSGMNFSSEEIAVALNLKADQVEEAFIFWENANIFSKSSTLAVPLNEPVSESAPTVSEEPQNTLKKSSTPSSSSYDIKPTEIAERINKSAEVKGMFIMAEKSLGRPLNHTEQRSYIWMHDYLGMPADVLITITAYCISIDRASVKYIEKLSADWAEKGINTLELVQEEIKERDEKRSYTGSIMKMFGMNRTPTSKQQEFIDGWQKHGYSDELIKYAYEKTIESIDKLSFPYIDKILQEWYSKGLITKSKIDQNDKNRKKKSDTESEHSYDLNDYKSLVNNFGD